MGRAEWMNGICLIWSRGRFISPSLPVGDDRYLNLSSQKRPTGRNLGGNRLVRRSGTTSRGTVALVCVFFAHAQVPSHSCSYHIRGNEMNCVGSSEYMTVFTTFTRASFLNMRADQSSTWLIRTSSPNHFVIILPYYSLCKMSKNGNSSIIFKILFFKNIYVYLKLIFVLLCSNQR